MFYKLWMNGTFYGLQVKISSLLFAYALVKSLTGDELAYESDRTMEAIIYDKWIQWSKWADEYLFNDEE